MSEKKLNWFEDSFERTINLISPKLGAVRMRNRYIGDIFQKRRYEGASVGRRTSGWIAHSTSANAEISTGLTKLRDRSRDLVRNNIYAGRAIGAIARNTVGKGIVPTPEIQGNESLETRIKKEWKRWAKKKKRADFVGRNNFYGIQRLVMRAVVEAGECLVVRKRVKDQFIPFKLQVLEADYIDSSKNMELANGRGRVIQGVEVDRNGKIRGYWLFKTHPGEAITFGAISSDFVPVKDILHIYREDRPGQLRGVPFGARCFIKLKDFDEYDDAQLVRQKIAACYSVFVHDIKADSLPGIGSSGGDGDELEKIQPGIIEYLPPGKDIKFANPPTVENFQEYSSVSLHAIASGFDVPYELLTGDLSSVNFSSARMGWLEFGRVLRDCQDDILIPNLLDPVWSWFIEALQFRGVADMNEEIDATWTPPRREMINPKEEIKAITDAVRSGLTSWSNAVRELGYDPDELIKEISKDFDRFEELGLMLSCDPRFDASRKNEEGSDDDEGGEGKPKKKEEGEE